MEITHNNLHIETQQSKYFIFLYKNWIYILTIGMIMLQQRMLQILWAANSYKVQKLRENARKNAPRYLGRARGAFKLKPLRIKFLHSVYFTSVPS